MRILRKLLIAQACAFVALLVVSGIMAAYGAAQSALYSSPLLGPVASAQLGFMYTAIIGLLPALLIGAPAYVGLQQWSHARWPYVLVLGLVPGLLVLPFEASLGLLAILCGAAVSLLTDLLYRQLQCNPSFKPTRPARRN